MPISIKHDAPAAAYGIPAFYAGQEDLRRYMDKMEQQRAQMMLQAQQAREENAVKVALAGAQLEAQANSQRAGQMQDFAKMQFGAGLNAAQDKVNFEQQQAIQQKGIDAQVAMQVAQQKAIADRMKADDERAQADRIRVEQLTAQEKAAAEKKIEQDRINQASAAEDSRTIDAVAKAANPQEKAAALDIIRKESESKTAQQIARDALLQTYDFSAEQQEAMKKANEQIKKIDAAILTPQQKFDMQKPHREVLDNMMPAARRKTLKERVERDPDGTTYTEDKNGRVQQKSPVKSDDIDQMFRQEREWYDSNIKAGMEPPAADAAARRKTKEYELAKRKQSELAQRLHDGEDESDIRADLERRYPAPAPQPQPAPSSSQPAVPGATPASTPPGQQPAPPQGLSGVNPQTIVDNARASALGQKDINGNPIANTSVPGIVAPATVKPLTAAPTAMPAGQQPAPQAQQQAGPVMPAGMTPKSGAAWRWASGDQSGGYTQEEIDKYNGVQAPAVPVTAADVKEVIQQPDTNGFTPPNSQGVVFQDKSYDQKPYQVQDKGGWFQVDTPYGTMKATSEAAAKSIVGDAKDREGVELVGVYDKNRTFDSGLASKEAREVHQALNGTPGVELKNGKPFQKHDFSMFKPVPESIQKKYGVIGVLPPGSLLNQGGEEAPLMVNDDKYTSKLPAGTVYYVKTAEGKIQRRQITKSPAREY